MQKINVCRKISHSGVRQRAGRGLLGLLLCVCTAVAAGGGEAPAGYDLEACVARALEASPAIQVAEAELQVAQAQLYQVRAARFLPKFDLTWIVGPSPEARGNALSGESSLSNMSVFNRMEASFVQPLYTFGKFRAAEDAAVQGVDARRAGMAKSRTDLAFKVAEAYYGLLLSEELWGLAREARDEIDKARSSVDEKLEEDTGEYTYTDLARIDRFRYDVEENANKVEKARAMVISALRMLMGLSDADSIVLAEERLRKLNVEIGPLDGYIRRAGGRPDLKQLRAGIGVRAAQVRALRTDYFPQLFIGGQFKYGYAPNRDDQKSPFAKDDFNFMYAGAVVGLRMSLAFKGTAAKVRKARMEHRKLLHQERLARQGVALEVERIYRTLREAEANVEAASRAVRATRRWFISARDGFNAGLEEAGELIDAVKEYGIIRAKYYSAVFEFNRAWVALQRATGNSIAE